MNQTRREILAEVLAGNMSLADAAPALREASVKEAFCLIANQEENGTYTLANVAHRSDLHGPLFGKPYIKGMPEETFARHYRPRVMGLFRQGKIYQSGQMEDPKEFLAALESLFRCKELPGARLDLSSLTDAELRTLVDVKTAARIKHR